MYIPKSIDTVKARIQELEAELSTDARWLELNIMKDAEQRLVALGDPAQRIYQFSQIGQHIRKTTVRVPSGKGKQPRGRVAQHEAARLAVEAAGHPLSTLELVAELPKFGAEIGGPNAARNLTSIVSKRGDMDSIVWRDRQAWWLKGKAPPP
jgi:hypothetical protein